jgi:hypothetical protein
MFVAADQVARDTPVRRMSSIPPRLMVIQRATPRHRPSVAPPVVVALVRLDLAPQWNVSPEDQMSR